MKRLVLYLAAGAFTIGAAKAQRIQIGPEIGINFSNIRFDYENAESDDFKSIPGLKIGGVVDIGFNRMVSFQPGLYYSMKGAREKYSYSAGGGNRILVDNKWRINYLEIPMNLQFKFGRPGRARFFAGAGPYIGFAIGGSLSEYRSIRNNNGTVVVVRDEKYPLEIGNRADSDDVKGTDAGLNINLGVIGRRGLFLRGNFGLGLANIVPGGDYYDNAKNIGFSLTAGYLFGR